MLTPLALVACSVNDTAIAIDRHLKGYSIYTPVDGAPGKYAIWEINTQSYPGMGVMKEAQIRSFQGYDDRDASVGGAWYSYALKGMYGDRLGWSKSPGAYIEYMITTEPGQVVSLINFKNTNGGIGAVTIDGQASLANLLPNTNGNRYVDFYSAQGPTPNLFKTNRATIPIANNLPGGTHTVRISFTGLKNTASSDTRILSDGVAVCNSQATEDETVRNDFLVLSTTPLTLTGAWESVFKVGATFYGMAQHGNETLLDYQFVADAGVTTPAVYDTVVAESFLFQTESQVSVNGAGPVALNSRTYEFTSEGLNLHQTNKWLRYLPMTHVYSAMWPILDGAQISDTARLDPFGEQDGRRNQFDLTANDLFFKGGFDAERAYVSNRQNARTFSFEVVDLDQNLDNPRFWVWDLGAPSYNKLYFQRQSDRYHVRQGETWTSTAKYRYYYDPLRSSEL